MALKRILFILAIVALFFGGVSGQTASRMPVTVQERALLEKHQDSLTKYAYEIVNGADAAQRFRADSFFIRMLVRSLKIPNSFYFPFDSLQTISKLYAPDSSFRIFTWQVKKDVYVFMQRGAIQMRTADGSLKLFPLHDVSMFTNKPFDSVRTAYNWIGAIYYRIIEKEFNGKKIYTLLGYDDFTINSNKKWMDVLTFSDQGQPVFGGPYFSFRNDSAKAANKKIQRFYLEYKKEATTTFNYDSNLHMIVYDHLISETEEPNRKETYVPDGDYEGFVWDNGVWLHVPKVFSNNLQDGQFPVDKKILNEAGATDEELLRKQSEKNSQKGK